jgi:hypothetical protein
MRSLFPLLFVGSLSMLFAEVFSGASQLWYINGWGILLTFPLYLFHLAVFLSIALKIRRTSLSQLYLFGVLFGLYESWITKVLWTGYMDSGEPGLGTLCGVGVAEFPILVFFWHPIMSFILPVLALEILTTTALTGHVSVLRKTRKKTVLILLFLLSTSTFIANGNAFDPVSSTLSLGGTLLVVFGFYALSKKADIRSLELGRQGSILAGGYLILLYLVTFFFVLPERIPRTVMPYVTILAFYAVTIIVILRSRPAPRELITPTDCYASKDFAVFMILLLIVVTLACIIPSISMVVLGVTYYLLTVIGIILFVRVIYTSLSSHSG